MLQALLEKKEKKVEYLELIYDLIFVYIIGRNNSLLHHIHDGFVDAGMFIAYVLCTLAVIQIWNFTTYYINVYGRNSVRDHVFLFLNMFLLYFVAQGTREDWQAFHTQYHVAWGLILFNIGMQYLIELRHHKGDPAHEGRIRRILLILWIESALVFASIPAYELTHIWAVSLVAILFGMLSTAFSGKNRCSTIVDFAHLSERAMLYVVFTFGEMIIAIASYFESDFSVRNLYFSAMAFLIVVGLFLSYGTLYDHILDREKKTNGLSYMLIHVFLIFALNNITTSLEFMRNEQVDLLPKVSFLTASIVLYYVCLFSTGGYAKMQCRPSVRFLAAMVTSAAAFAALMLLLRRQMFVNIALTAVCVFAVFFVLHHAGIKAEAAGKDQTGEA